MAPRNRTLIKNWKIAGFITIIIISLFLFILSQQSKPDDEDIARTDAVQIPKKAQIQKIARSAPSIPLEQKKPSLEEVVRIVAERNDENAKRLEVFEEDGWEQVEVDDPPDEELMQLSLSLIGGREDALQAQIQSNSFAGNMFERLSEIALGSRDDKTRYIALEALGRSGEKDAMIILTHTFDQIEDEESRSQIIGYLTPSEPDDEIAIFLEEQIANPETSDRLKRQAAFPLAVMSLLGASSPDDAGELLSEEIPDEWKDNFSDLVNLLAAGGHRIGND